VLPFSFNITLNGQGKVPQKLGDSTRPYLLRLAFGLVNLVFKVQRHSNRVVRVMYFAVQVQCGEHQLVDMSATEYDLFWISETLRSIQTEDWGEVVEDVGCLRYKRAVYFQDWGCKVRRVRSYRNFVQQIVRILRVSVTSARVFERKAYEFSASWNPTMIMQCVFVLISWHIIDYKITIHLNNVDYSAMIIY